MLKDVKAGNEKVSFLSWTVIEYINHSPGKPLAQEYLANSKQIPICFLDLFHFGFYISLFFFGGGVIFVLLFCLFWFEFCLFVALICSWCVWGRIWEELDGGVNMKKIYCMNKKELIYFVLCIILVIHFPYSIFILGTRQVTNSIIKSNLNTVSLNSILHSRTLPSPYHSETTMSMCYKFIFNHWLQPWSYTL